MKPANCYDCVKKAEWRELKRLKERVEGETVEAVTKMVGERWGERWGGGWGQRRWKEVR